MNRYPNRNVFRAMFFASLLGLAAVGCSIEDPNYSGEGNDFMVKGEITDVGKQSIEAEVMEVISATGEASEWFEAEEEDRFHDNCNCHGMWKGNKKFGLVENYQGAEMQLSDLQAGECVEISGKIRSSKVGDDWDDRPVFEVVRQVLC